MIDRQTEYKEESPQYFGNAGFHTYLGSDYVDSSFINGGNHLRIYHADNTESLTLRGYKNTILDNKNDPNKYIHNLGDEVFQSKTKINENLGIDSEDSNFGEESVRLANAKRGSAENGKKNFNVINLISTSGNLTNDLETGAGFGPGENGKDSAGSTVNAPGRAIKELFKACEKDDEYLLINIDATEYPEYTLTKLMIDGQDSNSDNAYSRLGSHVIYNFVQRKDNTGDTDDVNNTDDADNKNDTVKFEPYTGSVKVGVVTAGVIFAPKASVYSGDGLRGSAIANKVFYTGSGEIHHKSFGRSERRYVDITISNSDPRPILAPDEIQVSLSAKKELTGETLKNGQFSFRLNKRNADDTETLLQTVQNDANGDINFEPLTYNKEGTYTYTIAEVAGTEIHYTYDVHVITATVTISSSADNKLVADVAYSGNTTFTNEYKPDPKDVNVALAVNKALVGKTLEANQFTFALKDKSGKELQRVYNNADGKVKFVSLTYGSDQIGIHKYTITEIAGTDKHYTYDDRVINVTVTVALNAAGELEATAEYPDGDTFTNKYTPDKPEIHMNVNKYEATGAEELDGAKLQIIDKNGNVVGTWISKKGQSHDFGSVLKTGESYTLHEEAAPDGYEKIQDVTFTVEEDGQITINGNADGIDLENGTYKILNTKSEPTDDGKKETEETKGDDGNKGGDNGGGHSDHKKDTTPGRSTPGRNVAETEAPGEVLGAERERENPEVEIVEESEGTVKGVSRRKARTGDDSMMRAFGLDFFGALVLLLGWTVLYFRRKKK